MLVARLVRRRATAAWRRPAASEPALPGAAGTAAAGQPTPPTAAPDHEPGPPVSLLARGAAIFAGPHRRGLTGYGVRTALGAAALDRVRIRLAKLPRTHGRAAHRHRLRHPPRPADRPRARRAHRRRHQLGRRRPRRGRRRPGRRHRRRAGRGRRAAARTSAPGTAPTSSPATTSTTPASRSGSPRSTRLGMRPLRNERLELGRASTWPASTTWPAATSGDGPDFAAALGDRDPSRPVVLLAHQPVLVAGRRPPRRRPAALRPHPRRPDGAVQPDRRAWSSRSSPGSARSTAPRSTSPTAPASGAHPSASARRRRSPWSNSAPV